MKNTYAKLPRSLNRRAFTVALVLSLFSLPLLAGTTHAEDEPETPMTTVEGVVVITAQSKITVVVEGLQKKYTVAKDAKITRNEKPATLRRLRARDEVRITLVAKGEDVVATVVAARAPL